MKMKDLFNFFARYQVIAFDQNRSFASHWAFTRSQAVDWMNQYPKWARVAMYDNYNGKILAMRDAI